MYLCLNFLPIMLKCKYNISKHKYHANLASPLDPVIEA